MVRMYFWNWKVNWGWGTTGDDWEERGEKGAELMPSLIIFTSERTTWRNLSLCNDWMDCKMTPSRQITEQSPNLSKMCVCAPTYGSFVFLCVHTLVMFRGCCSRSDWSTLVKLTEQDTHVRKTIFSRQISRQRHLRYVRQVIWLETLDCTDSYIHQENYSAAFVRTFAKTQQRKSQKTFTWCILKVSCLSLAHLEHQIVAGYGTDQVHWNLISNRVIDCCIFFSSDLLRDTNTMLPV